MKYAGEYTNEISFPLGGIGSGSVGLSGNGRLIDWEIFNRPSKGSVNGASHFAIKATQNGKPITYILNGDWRKDFTGQYGEQGWCGFGNGASVDGMCGYPHFENTEFTGEFPFATITFEDENFPAKVKMTAFNPFIPGDEDNSSIPAAFFEIETENTTDEETEYQIALSLTNPFSSSINKIKTINGRKLFMLCNAEADENDIKYGDLTIACDGGEVFIQKYWFRGVWRDHLETYWNDMNSVGTLPERDYQTPGNRDNGTVCVKIKVGAKEKKKVRFVLSWNIPNNNNYWSEDLTEEEKKPWKNYYARLFENSATTAAYALENWEDLYRRTKLFKDLLHNSALPDEVIDAASANLSVLKSPTVLRLEDGSFYGWEGVQESAGSCEGTCQHVWNYAYALCFLFPRLERSIRDLEFKYSTAPDGRMGFRLQLPIGKKMSEGRACLDGQMGTVVKMYREWKISGDNAWLKSHWSNIKKVLEYAWNDQNPDKWDFDKDGVLEGRQHHTLDVELFGPSSWLEGMYLSALKAASEMAEFLGDNEKKEEYSALFEKGKKYTAENLFNGKYFIQKIDVTDKSIVDKFDAAKDYWNDEAKQIKYQIGEGSAIDQLLGQWHSDIVGLGDIFDEKQIDTALCEMMKNNFKEKMRDFTNTFRVFSLNDESGSVINVYPEAAAKPKIPIPYNSETMTGFEYSFAGLLMSRGKIDDGLKVVKAVRDRFDGKKRNPWNEFECGSNYARSMASYALIPILSGFEFDLPNKHIGFKPYKAGDFSVVWSVDGAWGGFKIESGNALLSIAEGKLRLKSFGAKFAESVKSVIIDGEAVEFEFKDGKICFDEAEIEKNLEIKL